MKTYNLSSSTADAYKRWSPTRPTMPDMQELMDTVEQLLAAGKYYTKDVYAGVIAQYSFTDEELTLEKGVEGGVIGMEIYYARKRLEEQEQAEKEEQARQRISPVDGKKLPNLRFQGHKSTLKNVRLVQIEEVFAVEGSAGNKRKRFLTTYTGIESAMKRAEEHKKQG